MASQELGAFLFIVWKRLTWIFLVPPTGGFDWRLPVPVWLAEKLGLYVDA